MRGVAITHRCKRKVALTDREVVQVVEIARQALKKPGDVSVNFVTNKQIQELNRIYRKKDKPTDILSFPADLKEELGDLFLSPAYINSSYLDFGHSKKKHYVMLLIHGVLHLIGYDHIKDVDYKKMQRQEKKLMKVAEKKIKKIL